MSDATHMHEIFTALPNDRIAKIVVYRVEKEGGNVVWVDECGPDLSFAKVRQLYGPGKYQLQAFSPGNRPISGANGTVMQELAGPPADEDDDEDEEDDDEDDEDEDGDDESEDIRRRPVELRHGVAHGNMQPRAGGGVGVGGMTGAYGQQHAMMPGMMGFAAQQPTNAPAMLQQLLGMGVEPMKAIATVEAMFGGPQSRDRESRDDRSREIKRLENELSDRDQELRDLKRRHERERSDLQDTHAQELRKANSENAERIATLRSEYDERLRSAAEAHRKDMARLENENEDRLATLKKRLNSETEMSTTPLQTRLSLLQAEASRATTECERLRSDNTRLDDENRKLRRQLEEKDLEYRKTLQLKELEAERDAIVRERDALASAPASSGGSTETAPSGALSMMKETVGMLPMIGHALQTIQKLNSGEPISAPTTPSKPAAPTVRPAAAAAPQAPTMPSAPVSPTVSAPPRVAPPSATPPNTNNVS